MVKEPTACQSIAKYCLEVCCCGDKKHRDNCPTTTCPLHSRRRGKDPNRQRGNVQPRKKESGQFFTVYTGRKLHRKEIIAVQGGVFLSSDKWDEIQKLIERAENATEEARK